jgi:hypothetical protein
LRPHPNLTTQPTKAAPGSRLLAPGQEVPVLAGSREPGARSPLSIRAVALGVLLIPPACWWLQYTECVSEGTDMAGISYVLPALFLLFLLVALNHFAGREQRGNDAPPPRLLSFRSWSQGELLTVFVMLSAGLTIGGPGGMQHLVMALGSVRWYAGARQWEWMQPFLPGWLFPERAALRGFFAGEAPRVPWQAWILPAAAWGIFILALITVMLCLASLLRRQWTDHERLTYPLVALPLAMTREGGELLFTRSRLFWTAALVTVAIESLNSLNYLYPTLPLVPVKPIELQSYVTERPWSAIGYFTVAFYPLVLGIGYLISLDVLFSYAFFYLLTKAQLIGCAALGWSDTAGQQLPYLPEQGSGAWIALALAALWMARRQLAHAVRRAWAGGRDDPSEPISYRGALLGVAGGLLFLGLFCRAAGMSFAAALGVLGLYFLFVVAAARVRAEAGTAWLFSPSTNPPALMVAGAGVERLGLSNLVGMACLQWFMLNTESVAMPYHLEAFRLGDSARVQRAGIFRAILLASVVGIAAAFWALLSLYYHYGAATAKVNDWRTSMGSVPWERLSAWTRGPHGADTPALEAAALGMAVVALLSALRLRFLWWPLHPIGYAVANSFTMSWLWFPCLLMWVLKGLILRYGGLRLYRRWLPFFLGLILGDYLAGALWAILGAVLDIKIYRIFVI